MKDKIEQLFQTRGDQRDMTIKCNVTLDQEMGGGGQWTFGGYEMFPNV